jgi:hypothetical protein
MILRDFWAVIFLSICFCIEAQTVSVGPFYSPSKHYEALGVVGESDGSLVLARATAEKNTGLIKDIQLELFDLESLSLKSTYTFENIAENKQLNYPEGIYCWNDKVAIFTSAFVKENKSYQLNMSLLQGDGTLSTQQTLLTSTTENFAYNRKRFILSVSENHRSLACLRLSKSSQKNESRIEIGRYDSIFSEISHFEVNVPFDAESPEIVDVLTDNPGNVHALIKGFRNEEAVYSMFAFPVFGNETVEYQLNIPGKVINSIKTSLTKEDKLLISGLTRERFESPERNSGVFFLRIDRESGNVEAKGNYRFDTDLNGLYAGEERKPLRNAFDGFAMNQIVAGKNNTATLIAEYFKEEEKCETDYRTGIITCFQVYKSGDVLLMNFNEKGSVDWFIQEVKKQQSTDDDGRYLGSVEVANKHLGLLIVYNGLPSKDANKPETTIEFFNKSTLTIQQISSNGQSSLEPLTTIPELPILPFTSRKLQNGATYILSEINGKASIVLLKP